VTGEFSAYHVCVCVCAEISIVVCKKVCFKGTENLVDYDVM
jgi:hypothetical protein